VGQDNVGNRANQYEADGAGIESLWG